jgi:hypothetical protein
MMAITTSNSINVNPVRLPVQFFDIDTSFPQKEKQREKLRLSQAHKYQTRNQTCTRLATAFPP